MLKTRKIGTLATLALLLVMAMLAGCGDDDGGSEEINQPYDTAYINSVLPTRAFCDAQGYRQENDYSRGWYFFLDSCQLRLWADFVVDSKWEKGYEPSLDLYGRNAFFFTVSHVQEISPKIKDLYWVPIVSIEDSDSLRFIPSEVFEIDSLHSFSLERLHGLDSLPAPVNPAERLDSLFVRDINLNRIPESYWDISWREIYLLDMGLSEIPPELANQTQLGELSLNGNEITEIPSFIGLLDSLKTFSIHSNLLTILPDNWCEYDMKYVHLGFNHVCTASDSLWNCANVNVYKENQECE